MSYNDIASQVQEIYGINISTGTLSAVTDKIINAVKEWQARPLETIYPIVWLDAIHYKTRSSKKSIPQTWLFGGPCSELTFTSAGCCGKIGIRNNDTEF